MKLKLFLLILLSMMSPAQNQQFIYEYKFANDSTDRDNVETELMILDVFKDGSQFYSRVAFVSDSLRDEQIKKMSQGGSRVITSIGPEGKIKFKEEKKYPEYKVAYLSQVGADKYCVEDNRKLNWKILPEKENIGEFSAQKATTDFAGRHWIAWFVSEIPIQDGPYKFHGLPGLIIKIEDSTQSHSFILKGTKKLEANQFLKSFKNANNSQPPIVLDMTKFKKIFLENRADPNKKFRDLAASGGTFEMTDASGKVMDIKDVMQMNEKRQMEANRKNNNILEIDLLR